jgi:hypothetical protein
MSKQTAVEWFFMTMNIRGILPNEEIVECYNQAKAMEKEQIVDANISGMEFIPVDPSMYKQDAEQYYNETYGK